MNRFGEFNIKVKRKVFVGGKINMAKILGKEIIILDFKIEESKCFKQKGSGMCLCLQISIESEKHIVFTSSSYLIEMIEQVPSASFPFATIIVEENKGFKFT